MATVETAEKLTDESLAILLAQRGKRYQASTFVDGQTQTEFIEVTARFVVHYEGFGEGLARRYLSASVELNGTLSRDPETRSASFEIDDDLHYKFDGVWGNTMERLEFVAQRLSQMTPEDEITILGQPVRRG